MRHISQTFLETRKDGLAGYISIRNFPSTRRNRPGSLAVLLLALQPVPPKLTMSSSTNILQRQINADILQGFLKLILEPVKAMTLECVPIGCADGKIWRCFPILSGWIADNMENVFLHKIKSNTCHKCKVPTEDLGIPLVRLSARYYTIYDRYHAENETHCTEIEHCRDTLETHGIKIGQNVVHRLPKVSPPDLHQPDMLHTLYLGLFKHIMDWI